MFDLQSNECPHVSAVMSSDLVLGYLRQLSGRTAYMEQYIFPSEPFFMNGHTFGSLQQAPQLMQCPLRSSETGSRHVKVRLSFAAQVFLWLLAIYRTPT